jgi:hypothetical protein
MIIRQKSGGCVSGRGDDKLVAHVMGRMVYPP